LTGGITISCVGTDDVFQRIVSFQGLNITCPAGKTCTDNSTASHGVSFQDCKIASDGRFFNGLSTSSDQRTYFTNCDIIQTNASSTDTETLRFNVGGVEIERVDINTNANASAILLTGTATMTRCSLSVFENTTTSATASPIVLISSTSLNSHNFGNTTFAYSSSVSKSASPTSNGIRIASGVNSTLQLLVCYFTLLGCVGSVNNVIGYNGVGSPSLILNECRSLFVPTLSPNTITIQSGIAKVNFTDINGPAIGSYSSSATQPIAVINTPQLITYNAVEFQFNTSSTSSRIYAQATGTYRFDYSLQLENTSGGDQTVKIWIAKGTGAGLPANVARSASQVVVPNNGQVFPVCTYTIQLNAGDYVSVYFVSGSTNVRALAVPAVVGPPALPAVPSIIVNLTQIGS
jgi:hypothetical protein